MNRSPEDHKQGNQAGPYSPRTGLGHWTDQL
jgi:hypothetical protein